MTSSLYRITLTGRSWPVVAIFAVGGALLSGCQSQPQAPTPPVQPIAEAPAVRSETPQEQRVRLLLLNGEYTLSQDWLITPANDNALGYFREVLRLDPNNARAKGGIQGIVLRYVDLARQAASRGHYDRAQSMLSNARIVDPANLLIKEVQEGLRAQMQTAPAPTPYKGGANEYLLDTAQLSKQGADIKAQLADIAHTIRASDSLAMIVARTDPEGRWIYQQLREASPGYLVRGDIQLGSPPRIKLVPRQ